MILLLFILINKVILLGFYMCDLFDLVNLLEFKDK